MKLLSYLLCLLLLTGCHTKINDVPVHDSNTFTFLEEDLYIPINKNDLIPLDLSTKSVMIKEAGNYLVSGQYDDVCIKINLIERGNVHLFFENLHATANKKPFLSVITPTKVTISLLENTNNIIKSDQTVIESNGNITFNGLGSLTISSPSTTVSSAKAICFCGGDYHLFSGTYSLQAGKIIAIHSGNIDINSQKDGLVITDSKGLIYMLDGSLTIQCLNSPIKNTGDTNFVGGSQTFKK